MGSHYAHLSAEERGRLWRYVGKVRLFDKWRAFCIVHRARSGVSCAAMAITWANVRQQSSCGLGI